MSKKGRPKLTEEEVFKKPKYKNIFRMLLYFPDGLEFKFLRYFLCKKHGLKPSDYPEFKKPEFKQILKELRLFNENFKETKFSGYQALNNFLVRVEQELGIVQRIKGKSHPKWVLTPYGLYRSEINSIKELIDLKYPPYLEISKNRNIISEKDKCISDSISKFRNYIFHFFY